MFLFCLVFAMSLCASDYLCFVACADPGIFVRGVQVSLTNFFFLSPQLILQKSNGQFQRNLSFFKVPEGVQHFPGGVQLLIPYRNPYNL